MHHSYGGVKLWNNDDGIVPVGGLSSLSGCEKKKINFLYKSL